MRLTGVTIHGLKAAPAQVELGVRRPRAGRSVPAGQPAPSELAILSLGTDTRALEVTLTERELRELAAQLAQLADDIKRDREATAARVNRERHPDYPRSGGANYLGTIGG